MNTAQRGLVCLDRTSSPIPIQLQIFLNLGLKDLLQLSNNSVTHVRSGSAAAKVLGLGAVVDGSLDSGLDSVGLLGEVERVAEHHSDGEDGADGVDNALAADIGSGAVDGLVDAVALALAIRNAAQGSGGEQADGAGDDGSLVGNDVAKEVAGDDDAVEGAGVLDEQHGGAVNELVLELELGELLADDVGHGLAPEAGGGKHVGLVQRPDLGGRVLGQGEEAGESGDALNLGAAVGLGVAGVAGAVVLGAIAEVDTAGKLTDDNEVGTAADLGLEGRAVDEGLGSEVARAEVAIGAELLAELQETLLGTDGGGSAPFGTADGTEKDGISSLSGVEGLIGEGVMVLVNGGLWDK